MDLVVDANGAPASRVADFSYSPEQATRLHLEIFLQVKRLLETGRVHGDLSAYNVLMSASGPTLIDLPQVVEVASNTNAAQILRRDLRNVTEHLARFDARLLRFADAGHGLFQHFLRGEPGGARSESRGTIQKERAWHFECLRVLGSSWWARRCWAARRWSASRDGHPRRRRTVGTATMTMTATASRSGMPSRFGATCPTTP